MNMNDAGELKVFTAFCRKKDRKGTINIAVVNACSVEEALQEAVKQCSETWNMSEALIECIGLAAGDIDIVDWHDY